ncbi:MAG TPA: hypothetical protein VFC67_01720 [Prolixibacteraceae bacterium]|nr:hypothetical protein [Prolixibacteraceae bacterium]
MNRDYRFVSFLTVLVIFNISCVSPKKFSFNNQQKHNYILSQKINDEKLKELTRKWLKENYSEEKGNNANLKYRILLENDSTIEIYCEDRLLMGDLGQNTYYYPLQFKMIIANYSNRTNIQFKDYLILNFSKNSVINKQIESKNEISAYFNKFNNEISNFFISKSRNTNIDSSYYSKRYISVVTGLTSKIEENQCFECRFKNRFEFYISGGYSYLLQENPSYNDFYNNYLNKLKNGYNINIGGFYNLTRKLQIGLEYIHFNSNNFHPSIYIAKSTNDTLHGRLSNNYDANYLGFIIGYRHSILKDYYINYHFGIGVLNFVDNAEMIEKYKQSKTKIIPHYGLSFEYFLTQQIGVSLGFTMNFVTLKNSTVKYENSNPKIQAYPFNDFDRIDSFFKIIYLFN